MCYGQFATFRLPRAYFVHVLHTIEVANPWFLAPNRTFTGIFNYLPLYWDPDRPDSMLYYLFSCCDSIATLSEPQFLLLPTVTCVLSDHVPKLPAEMQNSQLWTLITFFLAGFCYTIFYHKSCIYIKIIYPKFAPTLRSQNKVIFLWSGPSGRCRGDQSI